MTRSPDSLVPSAAGQLPVEKRDDKASTCRQGGEANPRAANVEVRHASGGTAKLTIPADSLVMLGPSFGQTVYLRALAGTVIELGLT